MPGADLPLRDIHLPDPVPWWPPAAGWWWAIGLAVLAIGAIVWTVRHWRQGRIVRSARARFAAIQASYAEQPDATRLVTELSGLARRVAVTVAGRERAAALTGDAWVRLLDDLSGTAAFSSGAGRLLTEAPYQRPGTVDTETLLCAFGAWLDGIPRGAGRMRKP